MRASSKILNMHSLLQLCHSAMRAKKISKVLGAHTVLEQQLDLSQTFKRPRNKNCRVFKDQTYQTVFPRTVVELLEKIRKSWQYPESRNTFIFLFAQQGARGRLAFYSIITWNCQKVNASCTQTSQQKLIPTHVLTSVTYIICV